MGNELLMQLKWKIDALCKELIIPRSEYTNQMLTNIMLIADKIEKNLKNDCPDIDSAMLLETYIKNS